MKAARQKAKLIYKKNPTSVTFYLPVGYYKQTEQPLFKKNSPEVLEITQRFIKN